MATEQLQVILNAVWRGKAAVQQAKKDIGKLDKETAKGGMSLGKLAIAAGAATVAIGATATAAKVAWDTMERAAAIERTAQQFDNLAQSIDTTADSLLGNLRTATRGMMTDAELMQSAGQIMSLGLADTEEGVARLASVVGQLGWDMNQVILTFANNSTMRLDALGLSIQDVTSRARELEAQGLDADKAFDLAVIEAGEEKIRLLGDASETTSGKMTILQTTWRQAAEDMQTAAGGAFNPIIDYLVDIVVKAGDAELAVQELRDAINEMGGLGQDDVEKAVARLDTITADVGFWDKILSPRQTDRIKDALGDIALEIMKSADSTEEYKQRLQDLGFTIYEDMQNTYVSINGVRVSLDELAAELADVNADKAAQDYGIFSQAMRDATIDALNEAQAIDELSAAMARLLSLTPSGNYSGDIAYDTRAAAIDKLKSIEVSGNYSGGDEYDKFIQKAAIVTSQATRASGAVGRAAGGFGAYKSAAEQAADAMQELSAETGNFFEKARQTDEINPAQMLYDMAKAAGASAKELADLGVAGGLFSAEEAAQDLNEAFLMQNAQQLGAMVAGGMAPEEALAALMDMQGQLEANQGLAEEFFAEVDGATAEMSMALDTNPAQTEFDTFAADLAAQGVTVPLRFSTSGAAAAVAPAGVGGGYIPGFARGGSFVVPPGYPNDSFTIGVQSGEHVEVTPRGQQRNNTGGNITINNYDRQSAALNATIIGLHRRAAILS